MHACMHAHACMATQASGGDITISGLAVKGPDGKLQRVAWFNLDLEACMCGIHTSRHACAVNRFESLQMNRSRSSRICRGRVSSLFRSAACFMRRSIGGWPTRPGCRLAVWPSSTQQVVITKKKPPGIHIFFCIASACIACYYSGLNCSRHSYLTRICHLLGSSLTIYVTRLINSARYRI